MATLERSLSGSFQDSPLEFPCSSATFFERPYQAEIMDQQSQFVTAGIGFNGTSLVGHRHVQHSCFDLQSNQNLHTLVGDAHSVVPHVTLGAFTNYDRMIGFPPQSSKVDCLQRGKKQKREDEDHEGDDYPARKKRLTKEACVPPIATVDVWGWCISGQVINRLSACRDENLMATVMEIPCEEMEQQSEHTPRTLQEIKDRITGKEQVESSNCIGNLPRLLFSDTLKEELRRDINGALTNKIVKSLNPPSMELVLWKPPPMFNADEGNTAIKECKEAVEDDTPSTTARGTAILKQTDTLTKGEGITASQNPTCSSLTSAWCSDEEMEL